MGSVLNTIYVFVPDISVFKDAFTLNPKTERQKTARDFLNFLAEHTEASGGFKYLRTPVEFTVKLLNDPLFQDKKIWGFLSLIMKPEISVFNPNVPSEKEILQCFKTLSRYKIPNIMSNDIREIYGDYQLTTTQFMRIFKEAFLTDRVFIRKG